MSDKKTTSNKSTGGKKRPSYRGKQGRKDSNTKRVNFDNARESKVAEDIAKDMEKPSANDISWYAKNPTLLSSAASISVAPVLGSFDTKGDNSVPGLMTFPWTPGFGGDNIPLKQCFDSMYSYIVHANSRNYRYTSPDLGMVTVAGMQVFACIASMVRAYGTVKYYQEQNQYVPDVLLRAQGFNPVNFRQNLGQIWFDLNNLINQTRQIWIPNVMPILDRWYWLNSMVFSDAEGVATQIYMFVQDRYFGFSETGVNTGSALGMMRTNGQILAPGQSATVPLFTPGRYTYDWSTWVTVVQGMINALVNSEDRGIMYGDILKAYGQENIRALAPIQVDYAVGPTFNKEVLMQIENYVPSFSEILGFYQDNEYIVTQWSKSPAYYNVNIPGTATPYKIPGIVNAPMLNFHFPEHPTPEQIVIATRMTASGDLQRSVRLVLNDGSIAGTSAPTCANFGSELPHPAIIWFFNDSGTLGPVIQNVTFPHWVITTGADAMMDATTIRNILMTMSFDWHPFIYMANVSITLGASDTTRTILGAYGDYDNYTTIESGVLNRIHTMAMRSELGVPHF